MTTRYIVYAVYVAATLVLPMAAAVTAALKIRSAKPVILGAVCFIVMQMCIRLPILQSVLPSYAWYTAFRTAHPMEYLILLALSAGVFEECGRYLFLKLGKSRRLSEGVSFGFGHGGIEAVLLVGLNAAAMMFRPSVIESVALTVMLLASAERIFAIAAHVGLSVIVLTSTQKRKGAFLLLAVALHGAMDFCSAYLALRGVTPWIVECFIAVSAAVIAMIAAAVWKRRGRRSL